MSPSFEEKSVWFQLSGIVLALGTYFVLAGRMLATGVRDMPAYAALLMVAAGALTVFLIVTHAVAAIARRPERKDERDRLIAWRAEHNSSWIAATGIVTAVACMALGVANVWTANILLLALTLSEVTAYALRLMYYRKGV